MWLLKLVDDLVFSGEGSSHHAFEWLLKLYDGDVLQGLWSSHHSLVWLLKLIDEAIREMLEVEPPCV